MYNTILKFQDQLAIGQKTAEGFKFDRKHERVVVCGIGGSIMPGLILLTYEEHKNKGPGVPIIVNNNYGLPSDVTPDDLVVCISWSGATEETISAYQAAWERKITPVVITKGSKLGQLAKGNNTPLITLPADDLPPRLGIGYMTGALFTILGLEKELDIKINPASLEDEGKRLTQKIGASIPLIYTTYSWRKLGALWKALMNEVAKTQAFWNYTPIMAHDELATYARKDPRFYPIFFVDKNDHKLHLRDLNTVISLFNELGYNHHTIELASSDKILENIFNNYILGLWTSYYLAKNLGVDPNKVELIDKFKQLKK